MRSSPNCQELASVAAAPDSAFIAASSPHATCARCSQRSSASRLLRSIAKRRATAGTSRKSSTSLTVKRLSARSIICAKALISGCVRASPTSARCHGICNGSLRYCACSPNTAARYGAYALMSGAMTTMSRCCKVGSSARARSRAFFNTSSSRRRVWQACTRRLASTRKAVRTSVASVSLSMASRIGSPTSSGCRQRMLDCSCDSSDVSPGSGSASSSGSRSSMASQSSSVRQKSCAMRPSATSSGWPTSKYSASGSSCRSSRKRCRRRYTQCSRQGSGK